MQPHTIEGGEDEVMELPHLIRYNELVPVGKRTIDEHAPLNQQPRPQHLLKRRVSLPRIITSSSSMDGRNCLKTTQSRVLYTESKAVICKCGALIIVRWALDHHNNLFYTIPVSSF